MEKEKEEAVSRRMSLFWQAVIGRKSNARLASIFPLSIFGNHLPLVILGEQAPISFTYLDVDIGLEAEEEALVAADEHRRGHGFFSFGSSASFSPLFCELFGLLENGSRCWMARESKDVGSSKQ